MDEFNVLLSDVVQAAEDLVSAHEWGTGLISAENDLIEARENIRKLYMDKCTELEQAREEIEAMKAREYNLTCRALNTTPEGREFLAQLEQARTELKKCKFILMRDQPLFDGLTVELEQARKCAKAWKKCCIRWIKAYKKLWLDWGLQ